MDLRSNTQSDILHTSFNQDNSCLAVGTQTGFFICDTFPMSLRFSRQFDEGIGIVEMVNNCNIFALVGGGNRPKYQPNCVVIWDDHCQRRIAELEFRSAVRAVKMNRERIIVSLESKIYIYNFEDLRLLAQYDTCSAKLGLQSLCPTNANIAFSTRIPGQVCLPPPLLLDSDSISGSPPTSAPRTKTVADSPLELLSFNHDGTRLAITSGKGTLIRILTTSSAQELVTLRRGTTNATIQSLAFSHDSSLLACTSNHGTLHVFSLDTALAPPPTYFGLLTGASEPRAVVSRAIPETQSICGFVPMPGYFGTDCNTLVILGASGDYYTFEVWKQQDGTYTIKDIHLGECKKYTP